MPSLQLVSTLPGHSEPAWSVAFNPTRSLLASCSTDRTVRIYSYTSPNSSSTSLSPETSLSTGSATSSKAAQLTTQHDPKPVFSLNSVVKTKHKRTVRGTAWAPTGRTLATASFDSTVGVWEEVDPDLDEDGVEGVEGVYKVGAGEEGNEHEDDENGEGRDSGEMAGGKEWECVTTLEGHESECKSVGFSSDGALLASCSRDKSVWVWEGEFLSNSLGFELMQDLAVQPDSDFECIAVIMEHSQDVKCIAWHPHEEVTFPFYHGLGLTG